MKTLKSLTMVAVLCAITTLLLAVLPLGTHGYYGEEQGFSAQVLLNKPGVTFDPTPLQNYADKDGSVVVKVVEPPDYSSYDDDMTYTDPQPGDSEGSGEANGTTGEKETTVVEADKDTTDDREGGSLDDFMWAPGTYYIYRSHYNSELGVVVTEVDESYPYFDESGYSEKWMNLSGVQVSIVIPTKWALVNVTFELRELLVEQELELNQSLVDYVVSLGYLDSGAYTYEITYESYGSGDELDKNGSAENGTTPEEPPVEPGPPTSYNMLYFTKDNITIYISSGLGGKTVNGPSEAGQTTITIEGPGGETGKEPYVSDMKKILARLGLNATLWEGVTLQRWVSEAWTLIPSITIDMAKMDWPATMRAELEWLTKEKVISGLPASDVNDICNLTTPGSAWMYDRVMYMDGKWTHGSALWAEKMLSLSGEGDSSGAPAPGTFDDKNGGGPDSTNNVGSGAMPMTIFAPGTASTDGPDNDMPQMTMIIAAIALCAVFFIIIFMGVLMFTRLRRNSILDNLNRKNIYELVKAKPGIHFNELIRTLDMQPGVLSHHLNVLEIEEYVKSLQDANHRRFYLYGTNTERKIMLTDLQLKILAVVKKTPGISQSNISKSIGRNRMIVNYHIKILRDVNMLLLEKSGRESMCYITDVAKLSLAS